MTPVRLDWRPRSEPLAPLAVLALDGSVRAALEQAWLRLPESRLQRVRRVEGPHDALLLLGTGADLPWAAGVAWLGSDPVAPALLLPTLSTPGVPLDLLQRACARRVPDGRRWLLWPSSDGAATDLLWGLQA